MLPISRRNLLKAGAAAGLAPLSRFADAFVSDADSFSFAYFSDTHVGLKNNIKEDAAMFAEMKDRGFAFGINGGDVTDYGWAGEYDNYQALIRELPFQIHHVAGNHDVRWSPQGVKIFQERLQAPYSAFEHKGVHFFQLDSTVPLSHWGHYEADQLQWLKGELSRLNRATPIFVTTHHWVGRDAVMVDNEEDLRKILEPYNVKILLNGHGHSDLLWNWDGIVNTMNKGLYQGSWEQIEIDRAKGETRLSRRTAAKPSQTLLATVPLAADRSKRPVWAVGIVPLPDAYEQAAKDGAEIRVSYGKWEKAATGPSLPLLLGRANGEQIVELKDARTGKQGTYRLATPESERLRKLWQTKLTGGVMSHIQIGGDHLYVSAMDGSVYAIRKGSGKIVWRSKTAAYCHSSPRVDGDRLYVGSADSYFYCLDLATGHTLWRAKTEGPVYASAAVAGDTVCVASGDGHFYALDRVSGKPKWTYEMPKSNTAFAQSQAVTDGERFYVGAWDSHLYAIDAKSGEQVWRQPCFPRTFAWSPAIGGPALANGRIYVPANGNGLFCFDTKSGEQLWQVSSRSDKYGHSSPCVVDGLVYVAGLGDRGEVFCLSAQDGSVVWKGQTGSIVYDSSPAVGTGIVAIGSVASLLSVLDRTSGATIAQTRLPAGHFLSSPAAEGRRIYAGTYSNTLTAFEVL